MTRLSRLLYLCVGVAWAAVSLAWLGEVLSILDGSETASAAVLSAVGGVMVLTTFTAAVGRFAWLSPVVSDQFAAGLLTTLVQTLVPTMTRLNRLHYVCVGVAWAAASLAWVGVGWAIWDGNKTASAAVGFAVGTVIIATILTAAVGWFAWKRRN